MTDPPLTDALHDLFTAVYEAAAHITCGACWEQPLDSPESAHAALSEVRTTLAAYEAQTANDEELGERLSRHAVTLTAAVNAVGTCAWCIDYHCHLDEARFNYLNITERSELE